MKAGRYINGWVITSALLAAAIIAGGLVIWSKWDRNQAIEIIPAPEQNITCDIQVDGAVNNPGIYPLDIEYSIQRVLRMAGGVSGNTQLTSLRLHVPLKPEIPSPQRVDINRAEVWLLESLPGIGETRARAIVEYRQQNGLFRNINELVKVDGIGENLYEEIKHLITVTN